MLQSTPGEILAATRDSRDHHHLMTKKPTSKWFITCLRKCKRFYIYGKISFLTDDKNISANEDSTGTRFPTQLTGKDAVGGWEWEAGCEGELTQSRGGQFSVISPNFK